MKTYAATRNRQTGVMLLEALISILIFSLGILAIVGLQAGAINNASDAKYRTDASLLANELIAQMWASRQHSTNPQVDAANLLTNFQNGGASYNAWLNASICPASAPPALPGIVCAGAAQANMPSVSGVTNTSVFNPLNASNLFTITLSWQPPGAASGVAPHRYVAVTQITQ